MNPACPLLAKNIQDKVVKKITCPKLLPAVLVIVAGLLILPTVNSGQTAFADSNEEPTFLVSEKLKKNPLAMKIIAEMEAQKQRYKQLSEEKPQEIPLTKKQIEIEENRKISEEMLQEDLKSMDKKYIDFTQKMLLKNLSQN